jgi:hypothetical protein
MDIKRLREGIKLKMEAMVMHHAYELHNNPDGCQHKRIEGAIRALDDVLRWIDDEEKLFLPTDYQLERFESEKTHWEELLEESKSKPKP